MYRLVALCFVFAVLLPSILHAHPGRALAPHDLLGAWTLSPVLLAGLVLPLLLFVRGARREQNARLRGSNSAAFVGWLFLALALVSPLHPLGEVLLSAHMVQHEILTVVAAPLLVLARPAPVLLRALSSPARSLATRALRAAAHTIGTPIPAALLHACALWAWHSPALYDLAAQNEWLHALEHVSFFGTALLFWWALLERPDRTAGAMGALFLTMLHTTALAALLTFAGAPWYGAYQSATAWSADPLRDQQLAGLIMWGPGGLSYLIAALYILARWFRRAERRQTQAALRGGVA